MTYTQNNEDYNYIHSTLDTMNANVAGFSETNLPWDNHHLTDGYTSAANKYAGISELTFPQQATRLTR
jgi:hypothetical protein